MPVFSTVTVTAVSTVAATSSRWVPLNRGAGEFKVGFQVVVTSGAGNLTYKVQHTMDDVFDATITPTAFDHSTVSGKTASFHGSYDYPITAIRLTVVSGSMGGSGTDPFAVMTVLQPG